MGAWRSCLAVWVSLRGVELMVESNFADFLRRIRQGDEEAATELVRRYEPLIRREVRLRLEDTRLIRSLDSMDISQSVLASFFVRAAAGEFDLQDPPQLMRLLVKMARNKLASQARWQFRKKREARRVDWQEDGTRSIPDHADGPSQQLSIRELLERARAALSDEERRITELRKQNHTWEDVARELGGTPHGRRMQLNRAIDRITRELGLDH